MRRLALILSLASSVALAQSTPLTPLRIAVVQKATAPSTTPGDCVNGVSPAVLATDTGVIYSCFDDGSSDYYAPVLYSGSPDDDGLGSLVSSDPVLEFTPLAGAGGGGMRWYGCFSGCSSAYFEMIQATSGLVTAHATGGATSGRWLFTGTGTPTVEVTGNVKATTFNNLSVTDNGARTLNIAANQTLTVSTSTTLPQTAVSGNAGTATALAANGANCGAGSAAGGVDASGAAEDCTAYQPSDADLTSIAALTTTAHGLGLLDDTDAAASRATVGAAYTIMLNMANVSWSPVDGTTHYVGYSAQGPTTTQGTHTRMYIVRPGVIRAVEFDIITGSGTTGSNESISVYLRLNNTTDYLIETEGSTDTDRQFRNAAMNSGSGITVAAGDYVEIKIVCPTWATNPASVRVGGYILVE